MQKSEIKILIIEDDPSLGRALEEGLKRAGYSPTLATSYNQAINSAKITPFNGLIADCMMPQKNGIDIALEILRDADHEIVTVLTSGIFKDKGFAHDAVLKTKAKAFLNKPFDIEELIKIYDDSFVSLVDQEREPLFQLLAREQYSYRDKIVAINKTEFIHGFDLPFVYSLLLDSQIAGELEIEYENKKISKIGFNAGRITKVQHEDSESYFGLLLIEKGYTTREELEANLNKKDNKPIGERLVENSDLSPHVIDIVQLEQMNIRISKTIQDTSVKIHFTTQENLPEPKVYIDGMKFTEFLSDWICSKIKFNWLKTFYTPWLESSVLKGPDYGKIGLLNTLNATRVFADILLKQNWPHTLQELLSNYPDKEEECLHGLHYFLLQRVIVFGQGAEVTDNFDAKIAKLNKIYANMEGKSHFDVLGVSINAKPSEIARAYHELAKNLHPDKLSPNSPHELKELAQKIFSKITESHQVLSNEKKRADYTKALDIGMAEEILKSETAFEGGLKFLKLRQYRDARKAFQSTLELKGHRSDTIIYMLWAFIKEKRHKADKHELAKKVKKYLDRVAHEDRHSPQYFFVKGMYYELTGEIQQSYNNFKHCIALDPSFLEAQREAAFIKQNYSKKSKSFSGELTTIIANIFTKKSG